MRPWRMRSAQPFLETKGARVGSVKHLARLTQHVSLESHHRLNHIGSEKELKPSRSELKEDIMRIVRPYCLRDWLLKDNGLWIRFAPDQFCWEIP